MDTEMENVEIDEPVLENDSEVDVDVDQNTSEDGTQDKSQDQDQDNISTEKITNKSVTEAIKLVSSDHPEQTKILKKLQDAYFRNQEFEKAFPTASEASSVKQLLDDIGGVDGIQSIQDAVRNFTEQDNLLEAGNPQVLDSLFNDYPDGIAKLAPAFLDKLSKTNQGAYTNAIYPHAVGMIAYSDVPKILGSLINQDASGRITAIESDVPRLQEAVTKLLGWYSQAYNSAVKMNNNNFREQPQNTELSNREKAISEKENKINTDNFERIVGQETRATITSELTKYIKQYNLNPTQQQYFRDHLATKINQEQADDKVFQKQWQIRLNKPGQTIEKLAQFNANDINKRLKDRTFSIIKDIYGNPKNTNQNGKVTNIAKPNVAKTTVSGGAIRINNKPDSKDVNWDAPNAKLLWIASKAYLKNGRFVTWSKVN